MSEADGRVEVANLARETGTANRDEHIAALWRAHRRWVSSWSPHMRNHKGKDGNAADFLRWYEDRLKAPRRG